MWKEVRSVWRKHARAYLAYESQKPSLVQEKETLDELTLQLVPFL